MVARRSSTEGRIWALRDRNISSPNEIRARSMRKEPTEAERRLWWHLRLRLATPGTHFRRQARIGYYIVDFVSHGLKLVIELDGGQHAERSALDAKRSKFLEREGYRVLRFWNSDVMQNIDGVLEVLQNSILATPTPTPPHKGEGKERAP